MVATKKAKRRKAAAVNPIAHPVPGPIDLGRTVSVTVKKGADPEIIMRLSDGAELKLKPVIMSIERSRDRYNVAGEPIYQIQAGFGIHVNVPKSLKRKVKTK